MCGVIAFLWIDNASTFQSGESELYSYWAPMLLIVLMAFAIATAFMNVLGIAIDTIVLCVCVDTQRSGAGSKVRHLRVSRRGTLVTFPMFTRAWPGPLFRFSDAQDKPYYASQAMLKAIGIASDAVSYGTGFVRVGPSG